MQGQLTPEELAGRLAAEGWELSCVPGEPLALVRSHDEETGMEGETVCEVRVHPGGWLEPLEN